jgi:hypothetical protein
VPSTGTAPLLRVVDLNGDGRPDIVSFGANVISVWFNRPGGWVAGDSVTVTSYPVAWDLAVGNIDGDGRLDVVTVDSIGKLAVYLRGSDGTWAPKATYPGNFLGTPPGPSGLAVGDVNGAGRPDVIAAGNLFIQRPMSMTSESLRPGSPATPSDPLARHLGSVPRSPIASR